MWSARTSSTSLGDRNRPDTYGATSESRRWEADHAPEVKPGFFWSATHEVFPRQTQSSLDKFVCWLGPRRTQSQEGLGSTEVQACMMLAESIASALEEEEGRKRSDGFFACARRVGYAGGSGTRTRLLSRCHWLEEEHYCRHHRRTFWPHK